METLLRQLFAIEGVTGALLLGKDGLVIASLMDESRSTVHAAHAAAIFDLLARYTRQLALGAPRQATIEAGLAILVLTEANDLILFIEAAQSTNLGRLRLESARIARELTSQMR